MAGGLLAVSFSPGREGRRSRGLDVLPDMGNMITRDEVGAKTSASREVERCEDRRVLTRDVVALLHELHGADGLVLLDLVGLVARLAVGLVVRRADLGADGAVAALPHHRRVAHVHRLIEGLQARNKQSNELRSYSLSMMD